MLVNIVGNGPSRELWDGSGWSIGCNIATDTDVVCVWDKRPLDMVMAGKWKPAAPLLLGPNAWEYQMQVNVWKRAQIVGMVEKHKGGYVRNAGQAAVLWVLRMGFRDIHLWGFDSIWTRDRSSLTHEVWGKPAKTFIPEKWNIGWELVQADFPDARLIVHAPEGHKRQKSPLFSLRSH